ncbi:DUF6511 domain-containing protein, partial [Peribacillus sp. NPDC060186]
GRVRHLDNPESCFLCRRRADGLGVHKGNHVGWLCQQCADGGYGMKAIAMRARALDEYETRALQSAGQAAGSYLDQIGQTDLAQLDPANWDVFCRILVEEFGEGIRREVGVGVIRTPDDPGSSLAPHEEVYDAEAL